MGIAFVKVSDSGNTGSGQGSSSQIVFTPTNAGDLLIIGFFQVSATNTIVSVTDTNGTTHLLKTQTVNLVAGMYYVPNCAAGAHTITVTYSGSAWNDLFVAEYSGADAVNPIDVSNAAQGASGVNPATTLTTTKANEYLVGWVHAEGTVLAVGGGFASRDTFDGNQVEDKPAPTIGTCSINSPTSALGNWLAIGAGLVQASQSVANIFQSVSTG